MMATVHGCRVPSGESFIATATRAGIVGSVAGATKVTAMAKPMQATAGAEVDRHQAVGDQGKAGGGTLLALRFICLHVARSACGVVHFGLKWRGFASTACAEVCMHAWTTRCWQLWPRSRLKTRGMTVPESRRKSAFA